MFHLATNRGGREVNRMPELKIKYPPGGPMNSVLIQRPTCGKPSEGIIQERFDFDIWERVLTLRCDHSFKVLNDLTTISDNGIAMDEVTLEVEDNCDHLRGFENDDSTYGALISQQEIDDPSSFSWAETLDVVFNFCPLCGKRLREDSDATTSQ